MAVVGLASGLGLQCGMTVNGGSKLGRDNGLA